MSQITVEGLAQNVGRARTKTNVCAILRMGRCHRCGVASKCTEGDAASRLTNLIVACLNYAQILLDLMAPDGLAHSVVGEATHIDCCFNPEITRNYLASINRLVLSRLRRRISSLPAMGLKN